MGPDELRVREETLRKLRANPELYLAEYTSRFANVLNADDAATQFDEYTQDPLKYRVAVHPAATWIRDELFRRALAETAPEGRNRVVFTAGGNAAGKSTALAVTGIARRAQVVFDSTFSNPEHAQQLMEQALGAGKTVTVLHVSRPLEEIFAAMLDRAQRQRRVVTIEQLLGSHRGSAQAVRDLSREFEHNPSVGFLFVDNSASGAREGTIELTAPQDYTGIRKRLYELLDCECQAGRITEEIYRRIRGGDRGEPPSSPSGRGGSGGGAPQTGTAESLPQGSGPGGVSPSG
jgi:Zeta toxin